MCKFITGHYWRKRKYFLYLHDIPVVFIFLYVIIKSDTTIHSSSNYIDYLSCFNNFLLIQQVSICYQNSFLLLTTCASSCHKKHLNIILDRLQRIPYFLVLCTRLIMHEVYKCYITVLHVGNMNKRQLSERDICTKFIAPAVIGSGWYLHRQIREGVSFTNGRIYVQGKKITRGNPKRADYILFYKPSIPKVVIET